MSSGANTPEKSAAIWSNDHILIKLNCWGIFSVKYDKRIESSAVEVNIAAVSCSIVTALKNKKDTTPGNVTLQENVCTTLQGLSRVLSAVTKHFISFKEAFGIQAVARTRSLWMLSSAKQTIMEKCFIIPDHRCPLLQYLYTVVDRCDCLWGVYLTGLLKLRKCCLQWIPVFVFLLSLSSFSQVYILPSHFHKAFPVWLSFKVADEEVMKTVNCLQAKAVFPLKLTS